MSAEEGYQVTEGRILPDRSACRSSTSTRVSLSTTPCAIADLDHLTTKMHLECFEGRPSQLKLEEIAQQILQDRQNVNAALAEAFAASKISNDCAITLDISTHQVVAHPDYPLAHRVDYLFAQNQLLSNALIQLQKLIRVLQMGKVATSAYSQWKQNASADQIQNLMQSAMYQLSNINGATFENGQLAFALDGQAERLLRFNRRFCYS